jgi:hypothetical protein
LPVQGEILSDLSSKPGLMSAWVSRQAGAAVVVVDSALVVVVVSARVVTVVISTEVAVVSAATVEVVSALEAPVVDEASARLATAVVVGRQGPASAPRRRVAIAATLRRERRTILS